MRKKSHISLARHIVRVTDLQSIDRHKKAFYVGSILPDCKPSFLTKRHEINETFDIVVKGIEKLTLHYDCVEELSTRYFTRLGEVIHYVADYFTFPHNREYTGGFKQHCIYEGELKHKLRAYIRSLKEEDLASGFVEEHPCFGSVSDISNYIKQEHAKYIRRETHSVEEDCEYIVAVCSRIAQAILQLCMRTIQTRSQVVAES